jgi:hypothetical protein
MLLARGIGALLLIAACWPGPAVAQVQVEPVPEPPAFDMFDLDAVEDPEIQLPGEAMPPGVGGPDVEAIEIGTPPATNTADPCRHFTDEERRLLPSLCGASD